MYFVWDWPVYIEELIHSFILLLLYYDRASNRLFSPPPLFFLPSCPLTGFGLVLYPWFVGLVLQGMPFPILDLFVSFWYFLFVQLYIYIYIPIFWFRSCLFLLVEVSIYWFTTNYYKDIHFVFGLEFFYARVLLNTYFCLYVAVILVHFYTLFT